MIYVYLMARKSRQPYLDDSFKGRFEFGGSLNKNSNPKVARSISTKHAMHVVLRSGVARGRFSLINKASVIRRVITKQAEYCGIRVYQQAVASTHVHLLIYIKTNDYVQGKLALTKFFRIIGGLIPRLVLGAERGKAKNVKFWLYRPYTRVVNGFIRGYRIAKDYVLKNHLEAIGVIAYQPRKGQPFEIARAGP
jgi:hypothetical protein